MAVTAVITDGHRTRLAEAASADPALSYPYEHMWTKFKIGEGGFDAGPPETPATPDPTRTDIVAQGVGNSLHYEEFTLLNADVTDNGAGIVTVICALDTTDGNDIPWNPGVPPEYWEVGVFDEDDIMVIYATFDGQVKDSRKALEIRINVDYSRP